MSPTDGKGDTVYSVRIARHDGKVVGETSFADQGQALRHFHEMVRSGPQPNVYVEMRKYTEGKAPEVLETGFYFGLSRPGQG